MAKKQTEEERLRAILVRISGRLEGIEYEDLERGAEKETVDILIREGFLVLNGEYKEVTVADEYRS